MGMKIDLFQSYDHCWVCQLCWHTGCSTLTASAFRTWDSSVGIPLPPLALFVVMFPKAHLTSHSRISGSRWVDHTIMVIWVRPFLYSSFMYSCHLFLIASASIRSLLFLSFIVLTFAWNIPLVFPVFFKRSLVFPILLFSYISLHCSLKAFLSLSWVYLSLSLCLFLLFSQLFVRPFQTGTLLSCISLGRDGFGNHFLYSVMKPCP